MTEQKSGQDAIEALLRSIDKRLTSQERAIKELGVRVEAVSSSLDVLDSLDKRFTSLKVFIRELRSAINAISAAQASNSAETSRQLDKFSSRIDAFKEGIRDLKDADQEGRALLGDLRRSVDRSGIEGGRIGARLAAIESRVTHVQHRLEGHLMPIERQVANRLAKDDPDFEAFFAAAQPVISQGRTLLDYDRLRTLWEAVRNTAHLGLPGVELGTYRGGSAWFLITAQRRFAAPGTPFHVIDTFTGHPPASIGEHDSAYHEPGRFADTSVANVREYLGDFDAVTIHEGDATELVEEIDLPACGFVHLDVDLYLPTLTVLRSLAPRLGEGGVIVVDDYGAPKCPGVKQAVSAFLAEHEGFAFWPTGTEQAIIVRDSRVCGGHAVSVDG